MLYLESLHQAYLASVYAQVLVITGFRKCCLFYQYRSLSTFETSCLPLLSSPENHRLETLQFLGLSYGNIAGMPMNYAEW